MSANGSWTVVGGTSASSPFTAALIAVAKGHAKSKKGVTAQVAYTHPGCTNDITTGSNGDSAKSGWDPATGLGSPAGHAFIDAIVATIGGITSPIPVPSPPVTAPPKTLTLAQAQAVLAAGWPK